MIQNFNSQMEAGNEKILEMPLELSYFNVVLFLLGLTAEDKNNATESKG